VAVERDDRIARAQTGTGLSLNTAVSVSRSPPTSVARYRFR
jgi:hypothetical protein